MKITIVREYPFYYKTTFNNKKEFYDYIVDHLGVTDKLPSYRLSIDKILSYTNDFKRI